MTLDHPNSDLVGEWTLLVTGQRAVLSKNAAPRCEAMPRGSVVRSRFRLTLIAVSSKALRDYRALGISGIALSPSNVKRSCLDVLSAI